MDLANLKARVEGISAQCGELARTLRAQPQAEIKPDGSIVTIADRKIEEILRKELTEALPGSTVWGEEQGFSEPGTAGIWLVDPIDGTSNYRYGLPHWGISIGLIVNFEVVLGVIVLPDFDLIYSAHAGGGATRNGAPLSKVAPGCIRAEELVSFSDLTLLNPEGLELKGKMRYLGAFVCEAMYVCEGKFRGMISHKANLYDAAASICIAQEVGLEVYDAEGKNLNYSKILNERCIEKPFVIYPAGNRPTN